MEELYFYENFSIEEEVHRSLLAEWYETSERGK